MDCVFLHDYMEVESMCSYKCQNMRILALFIYFRNEILAIELNSCSLWSYWRIMVNSLFVDICMNMWVFLVKVVLWVSRVSFRFTRKVVSLSYTPCTHLTWGIELGLKAPWTMLSRIRLVPRVIHKGLGLKEAISYLLGELGASFIPSYHEISIGGFLS